MISFWLLPVSWKTKHIHASAGRAAALPLALCSLVCVCVCVWRHHPDALWSPEHLRGPAPTHRPQQRCIHGFVTHPEHVCLLWAISNDQLLNRDHVGDWSWFLWLLVSPGAAHRRPAVRESGATEPCGSECKYGAVIVSAQRQHGSNMAAHELPRGSSDCMSTFFSGAKTL